MEWVYRTEEKNLWAKETAVALLTNDGHADYLKMHRKTTRRTADAIVNAVSARNPDVLVGLTRENQRNNKFATAFCGKHDSSRRENSMADLPERVDSRSV